MSALVGWVKLIFTGGYVIDADGLENMLNGSTDE